GIKSLNQKTLHLDSLLSRYSACRSTLSLSLLHQRSLHTIRPDSLPAGSQGSSVRRRLVSVRRRLVSILAVSQMDTSTGGNGSSNKNSSSTASTKGVGVKQKTDIAWNYFEELVEENGSKVFRCLFCAKVYKGGGINRMKQHLAGITGQISRCLKVPFDVREKIQNNLTEFNLNKLEKKKADASVGMTFHENRDTNNVVQNDAPLNTMDELTRSGSGGPVRVASVDDYFAPRTVAGAQPGIKAALAGKEALHSEFYIADSSSSTQKAMNVEKIVLDNMFWGDCLEIVKVVTPIMKLLRFVDSDEKPSLGYVYKGMALIIEGIKNIYPDNESKYKPYTDIVEKRVDKHFRGDMHRAAYYFNPALAYNHTGSPMELVKSAVLNLFELKTYCTDGMAAVKELKIYEEAKGSFGRELAIRGRSELHPDVWWSTFGDSAPNLQKIAIRLLSQTSTSSGCERNWSVFERIHTDRRNKLEEDKLCDLVFVNYNLKLKNSFSFQVRVVRVSELKFRSFLVCRGSICCWRGGDS
ncbi:hypothetical protein LINPERPRIM_LOCUS5059, partial [Linum perenne]